MSGPAAGEYDPVPATICTVTRALSDSNEPLITGLTPFCERYLRILPKTTLDANRELTSAKQQISRAMLGFRVRRDEKTLAIESTMVVLWRGGSWEIVGDNVIDYNRDEIEFLAQSVKVPVT